MISRPGVQGGPKVYSVAELVNRAHLTIEQAFNGVHVEGEVTNLRIVSSGHAYFTLTAGGALLPVAMWRSAIARLRFRMQDGQRLRVFGRPGIYAAQGKFQLYAERAEPAGQGALLLQLERLKAKLAAEGLFAAERKRKVPRWPTHRENPARSVPTRSPASHRYRSSSTRRPSRPESWIHLGNP